MASTPEAAPVLLGPQMVAISEARKQMLIDNLQLEVTERARRLRALYANQAKDLRSRIERRIYKIPHDLRHEKMQSLIEKCSQAQPEKALPRPPSPHKITYPALTATDGNARGVKRTSDTADKENANPVANLENPKKRVKTAAPTSSAMVKTSRTVSRKPDPGTVLSPKSQNSRTLPASPTKPASPVKESVLPKPSSRIAGTAAAKQVKVPSRQVKRPAAATATAASKVTPETTGYTAHSRHSTGSDDSDGTTIVKKPASKATATTVSAAAKKATPAATTTTTTTTTTKSRTAGIKGVLSSLTGSKRGAAGKKAAAVAPTATTVTANSSTTVGGRTLRKRGSPAPSSKKGTAAPLVTRALSRSRAVRAEEAVLSLAGGRGGAGAGAATTPRSASTMTGVAAAGRTGGGGAIISLAVGGLGEEEEEEEEKERKEDEEGEEESGKARRDEGGSTTVTRKRGVVRISSGRVEKKAWSKRNVRSSSSSSTTGRGQAGGGAGLKVAGSRRLGRLVERGKGLLFTRSKKRG